MKKAFGILFFAFLTTSAMADFIAFPEKDVESILSMSYHEIFVFSQKKEIELYKFSDPIPSESKDIATSLLSQTPFVDQKRFSSYPDLFDGSILGVYFSKQTGNLHLKSDLIIFSDQADRWTVAHEFSHALIDKMRSDKEKKDEVLNLEEISNAKEDYEEVMALYRTFGYFPGKSYIVRALDSINVWSELLLNFLYIYELEEVRIEKFLQKTYEAKPAYKLDAHTYQKSFWYVGKNCGSARQKINHSLDVLTYFETLIPRDYKEEMRSKVDAILIKLQKHEANINSLCD